jgi:hypothetical protein
MGQSAGTENRSPAKVTERHDDGTDGAGLLAIPTALGDQVKVSSTLCPSAPWKYNSTPRAAAM